MATGLTKVAIVHLALRGYSTEELKGFEIALTATSAMEELYRIETWQTRTGVMADLKDLGWFPKEWIVTHFTDLSPDEIEEIRDMEDIESDGGVGGGKPFNLGGSAGGGPDLGGPDLGGPDLGETEEVPDLGDSGVEGGAEGLDADMGEEPALEGFDYQAEKRLLLELRRQGRIEESRKIVDKWAQRVGKLAPSNKEYHSGFDHLLEIKELDGLTSSKMLNSSGANIQDPNRTDGLLVEWSVDEVVRNEAINEVLNVLSGGLVNNSSSDDGVITEDDIAVSAKSVNENR